MKEDKTVKSFELPALPLREAICLPKQPLTLFVGREKSIKSLDIALDNDLDVVLVMQRNTDEVEPSLDDVYKYGVVCKIVQMLKLHDGTVKVVVEGIERCEIKDFSLNGEYFSINFVPAKDLKYLELLNSETLSDEMDDYDEDLAVLRSLVLDQFRLFINSVADIKNKEDLFKEVKNIQDYDFFCDSIANHIKLKPVEKQKILETIDIEQRLNDIYFIITRDTERANKEREIQARVQKQAEKINRQFYLNEKIKAIRKEFGDIDEESEAEELLNKLEALGMPQDAFNKVKDDIRKLKMMPSMSSDANVLRNYIDWILQIPWNKFSKIKKDIIAAKKVLDKDHYGLDDVKERILEYLAVQTRVEKSKSPILCLVGPPGVGKTSLGQSIARATGREYVRMALGGVRDEAEIRGHRKTYIGALPGKLMQRMAKASVVNPLFLLDEIDKMTSNAMGDPASALLEVLDPEQNEKFNDHYLEVDYDLSNVMFIATSNSMNIPPALRDRMEIIHLSGYTEDEKLNIAKEHLIAKQIERAGLKKTEINIKDKAILDIIRYYTREAGVRNLERDIAKICRKVVRELLETATKKIIISEKNLAKYLGVRRFDYGKGEEKNIIGEVTGLAWTSVGGELLVIEAVSLPGKGKISTTGSLGKVMQESMQAALTVVRARADKLGLANDFYDNLEIHVHVPEGATPKDGPSAGVTICTALVSRLTNIAVKPNVAMTGEVTLSGKVLTIGGLKEKLLAALRGGVKTVIIPEGNEKDLAEIPQNAKEGLEIIPVKTIDEVLEIALVDFKKNTAKLKKELEKTLKTVKSSKNN